MEQGGNFPAGYKFSPSQTDLVNHYLRPKVYNQYQPYIGLIYEFDFYQNGPDWLSENFRAQGVNKQGVPEWYFFTARCKKYPKGTRPTRVAGDGYWNATSGETDVKDRNKSVIAKSRNLVYYHKKDGIEEKTNWIMKEYMINDESVELNNCVLCVMYRSDHSIRISKAMKRKKNKNLIIMDEDDNEQQNAKRLKPPPPIQSSPLPMDIPINSVMPPLTIEAAPEPSSLQPPMEYQQSPLEYQQQVSYENGVGASNNYTQMMENQQAPMQNQQLPTENEPLFSNDEVSQHLTAPDGNTQSAQNHQPSMENQQQFLIENNFGGSYYMPMENQQQLRLDNNHDESYNYQQIPMEHQQQLRLDNSLEESYNYQQMPMENQQQLRLDNSHGESYNYQQIPMENQQQLRLENQQAPMQNQQLLNENEPLFSNDELNQYFTQTVQNHQPAMENQQQFRIDNNLDESYNNPQMPVENQQQLK